VGIFVQKLDTDGEWLSDRPVQVTEWAAANLLCFATER